MRTAANQVITVAKPMLSPSGPGGSPPPAPKARIQTPRAFWLWATQRAGGSLPLCPVGGPGGVLARAGRPSAGVRGSVLLLPGPVVAGPPPCRAVRPHAGHSERWALDRRQNGGQLLAGSCRGLALLILLLGSRGGSGKPVAHRAQTANLRPRLEGAIRRVEHEHHTDKTADDQADHESPALSLRGLLALQRMPGQVLQRREPRPVRQAATRRTACRRKRSCLQGGGPGLSECSGDTLAPVDEQPGALCVPGSRFSSA